LRRQARAGFSSLWVFLRSGFRRRQHKRRAFMPKGGKTLLLELADTPRAAELARSLASAAPRQSAQLPAGALPSSLPNGVSELAAYLR
jgi:hypothetical protein